MTLTTLMFQSRRLAAAGLLALSLGACMDMTNVPNYDNESLSGLVDDPTPARVATAAQGMLAATRLSLVGVFGFIADMSFKGREGYTLDPATPGLVPENLVGPLDPALRSFWSEGYRAIKLGDVIMTPIDALDGTMARLRGESTDFGAFVDSVSDRYSE